MNEVDRNENVLDLNRWVGVTEAVPCCQTVSTLVSSEHVGANSTGNKELAQKLAIFYAFAKWKKQKFQHAMKQVYFRIKNTEPLHLQNSYYVTFLHH